MENIKDIKNLKKYVEEMRKQDDYVRIASKKGDLYKIQNGKFLQRGLLVTTDGSGKEVIKKTRLGFGGTISCPVAVMVNSNGEPIPGKLPRIVDTLDSEFSNNYMVESSGLYRYKNGPERKFIFVPKSIRFKGKVIKAGSYIDVEKYKIYTAEELSSSFEFNEDTKKKVRERNTLFENRQKVLNKVDEIRKENNEIISRQDMENKVLNGLMFIAEHPNIDYLRFVSGLLKEVGFYFTLDDIQTIYPEMNFNIDVEHIKMFMSNGDFSSAAFLVCKLRDDEIFRKRYLANFLNDNNNGSIYDFIRKNTDYSCYSKYFVKRLKKYIMDSAENAKLSGDALRTKVNIIVENEYNASLVNTNGVGEGSKKTQINNDDMTSDEVSDENAVEQDESSDSREVAAFQEPKNVDKVSKSKEKIVGEKDILLGIKEICKEVSIYDENQDPAKFKEIHDRLTDNLKKVGCDFTVADLKIPIWCRKAGLTNMLCSNRADLYAAAKLIAMVNDAKDMYDLHSVVAFLNIEKKSLFRGSRTFSYRFIRKYERRSGVSARSK